MTAAEIGDRLDATPTRHGGWEAGCPCCGHGSGRRIAIDQADDGRTLVYPRCGCDLDDVLEAAGLTRRDLFPAGAADHDAIRQARHDRRSREARRRELAGILAAVDRHERQAVAALHADETDESAWAALAAVYHARRWWLDDLEAEFHRLPRPTAYKPSEERERAEADDAAA